MPRGCRTPDAPTPITVAWRRNSQNGRIRSLVSNPFTTHSTGHTSWMAATSVILKCLSTLHGLWVVPAALCRSYFLDAHTIGDPEVLIDIARSVGLPSAAAREVLAKRTFKEAVDADWEESRRRGITGVPSF